MQVCIRCGVEFDMYPVVDGERMNLRGRKHCLVCLPVRRLRAPRKKHVRARQQLTCEACGQRFPAKAVVDGVMRWLHRRRFCLSCSPFGSHNTSKVAPGCDAEERARKTRGRRLKSYVRCGRERRRRRKRELVERFGGVCVECGYGSAIAAMEFHHRDPLTKSFSIAKFGGSYAELLAEAEKCDLLCANCHRQRHLTIAEYSDPAAAAIRRMLKQQAVDVLGGKCEGCGRKYDLRVFEFHHRNAATKTFGISQDGVIRPWDEISAELAKCTLLCANCHRETHAGLRGVGSTVLKLAEAQSPYTVAA